MKHAASRIAILAALVCVYAAAGKLGLMLAFVHASASAVWPPTGIALAAILILGPRAWPAIALGAFIVNVTTAGSVATSLGIAAGNTLEALVGAWLVNRFAGGRRAFDRAVDVFKFAGLAAVLSTMVSATIGVTTLSVAGYASWSEYGSIWLTWWLGDAVGALVITPALVLWTNEPRIELSRRRTIEAVLLLLSIVLVGEGVFGGFVRFHTHTYPLEFLGFPPLIWAAFRFGQREAATALIALAGVALLGTLRGTGPFALATPHESLLLLQTFMGTLAAITIPTAALVSERKRADSELLRSESAYRQMFENNPHPMWIVDLESLRFLAVNDAATERYGYTRAEMLGMTTLDIRPPDEIPRVHAAIDELRQGMNSLGSYHHRTKDGRLIDVEVSTHHLTFGGRAAALVLAYDITERTRAEDERRHLLLAEQAARADAENANRVKDEFLATLSHELRTPLNAMLGWVTMLRAGDLDPVTAERAVETIERNTRLQAKLVEDLLDVSRIISGKFRLETRTVDLVGVVESVLEAVRSAADAKTIRIDAILERPLAVSGDPARLQQVVWNLVSNAVKFTGPSGRVTVELASRESQAVVTVTDTGRGISAGFLPYIFERFRQAEGSTTRAFGGLGLGLAIVRHLVELHGGTVEATSPGEGAGATFTIRLPRLSVSAPSPAEREFAPRTRRLSDSTLLEGVSVLVVDDDRDAADYVRTVLSLAGARVHTTMSAAEALAAFHASRPDILVADIAMPGEDGYALIQKVRAFPAADGGNIPALALTAYARAADRARALSAGYQAHLAKPVEPTTLATTVAELLASRGK